jgi:hypothetical protein
MITNFIVRTGLASQLIASAVLVLICGFGSLNASAQDVALTPTTNTVAAPHIDPVITHEITVAGSIQQIITTNTPDLRIRLLTPQGILTADLGPSLRKDVKEALTIGQQIQITGTVQTINGQAVLFTRILTFNDRLVIVRNEHAFPVHTTAATLATAKAIQNGEAK